MHRLAHHRTCPFARRAVGLAAAVVVAHAPAAHAQGQGPAGQPPVETAAPLPQVLITGQAVSTDRALRDQEAADNVISVVRADGIGRLPDKNAAEAVQRLPGVSIERDQGEGRYVRIRGIGPDLNAVTVNGALMPAPEAGRRAVALDVLPSSLVRALVVTKTLTPDMDANSLGGTVDVQTLSAFDQPGRFFSIDLGASHETNTDRTSPNGALVWSDRFADGRLGIALGISHEQRRFGSDNVETGGAWDGEALEGFERRDYRITRERTGVALNIEWKPEDDQLFYVRALGSRFADDEQRQAHTVEFDEAQAEGALGEAESVRELRDRKETQEIRTLSLGGDVRLGDWRIEGSFGMSESREKLPSLISAVFEADDAFADTGFTDGRRPRLIGPVTINDAAPYALEEIEVESTLTRDRERHLRLDLSRSLTLGGTPAELKFGAKASRRTKTDEQTTWVVGDLGDPPLSLSDAQRGLGALSSGQVNYPFGTYGPAISPDPLRALLDRVNLDDYIDDEQSTIADQRIEEDIDAAYLQSKFDLSPTTNVLAGVRVERTRLHAKGTGLEDGEFVPVDKRRSQTHWLPGLHLRHDLDPATAVRAAWTNSVVRPTFEQLSPAFVIDGDEAEFGDPELRAMRSSNFDVGVERQLGYASAVSAYLFHKRIRDFVYQTDVAGTGRWADFDEAITFANGDKAHLTGLEVAWSRAWRDLPGAWGGLVTSVNATFSHSSARIGANDDGEFVSRSVPLPNQSSRVFNAVVGYETPAFAVRLAANHKSHYLLEVGDPLEEAHDLYVDAQTQWDLSARYSINERVSLVFEALNLSDEPYYVYQQREARNAQYETYGRTYRLAMKIALY